MTWRLISVLAAVGVLCAQEPAPDPVPVPVPVAETTRRPVPIQRGDPQYPDEARNAGVNSTVLLSVIISVDGTLTNVQVARGSGFGLDEKAVEAVRAWRFRPAEKDGVPVPVAAQVEVKFRLLTEGDCLSSRLEFSDAKASRPVLLKGVIPDLPEPPARPVKVGFVVGEDGTVLSAWLAGEADPLIARAVLQEVETWKFEPSKLEGRAVAARGLLEISSADRPGRA